LRIFPPRLCGLVRASGTNLKKKHFFSLSLILTLLNKPQRYSVFVLYSNVCG
jgi:hypothetical protein